MKPSAATTFRDDWLTNFSSKHLFHELKMLWWLHQSIPPEDKTQPEDAYLRDALVESFVLHLRNLIHFFCLPRDRDDVIAEDFFDDPARWSKSKPLVLKDARLRADKELSHLTAMRKDEGDPQKPWDIGGLFREIAGLAENFVANASQNKLHAKVRDLVTTPEHLVVTFLATHSHRSNVIVQVATGTL